MKPMIDMEMDDEAAMDAPTPMAMTRETYPYGLRICLCGGEMKKLELDPSDATVGGYVHLHAIARITNVSASDGPSGPDSRVELQIEKMAVIESEDRENEEAEGAMKKSPLHDRS